MATNANRIEVLGTIQNISGADSEDAVRSMTRSVIRHAGAEHFIFSTLRLDRSNQPCRACHYFEDCSQQWRSIYDERKWYMNDPLVEYAKSHSEPTLCSNIVPITRGQADMLKTFALHGFRSGMVVPAHGILGAHECLGILLIGSPCEPDQTEPLFLANRISLRALAMELMDWWKNHFRNCAVQKLKLKQLDLTVLEYLRNGKTVAEISAIMEIRPSTLYHQLAILKDKLRAAKNVDAVVNAKAHGLLG